MLSGPWTYACVKLAKKYGIEVEPVKVVELLDWNFDETPKMMRYCKMII